MSRRIINNNHIDIEAQKQALRQNEQKFLLFFENDTYYTFLIHNNKILKVESTYSKADDLQIGTILIAKVDNVVEQMHGCFLSLNSTQKGFLSLEHGTKNVIPVNRKPDGRVLAGDELVVSVTKEAQKKKPIQVSLSYEIPDVYTVFKRGTGKLQFSGKLSDSDKEQIKQIYVEWKEGLSIDKQSFLSAVNILFRTKAASCNSTTLFQSMSNGLCHLQRIDRRNQAGIPFDVLYKPEPSFLKIIEDQPIEMLGEVVTDNTEIYNQLSTHTYIKNLPIRLYQDNKITLKKLYALNTKLRELLSTKVSMKSGAYIVIEQTEALVSIDVNSGKKTKKTSSDEYYYQCNKEAADEILYQLSVRNISGMIIIDFINMKDDTHVQNLISYIQKEAHKDPVTTTYIDYTQLGLVEMTRRKSASSLSDKLSLWDLDS